MSGPRTTSTSTKVDNCAHIQRAKMVERFHVDVLDRKAKPSQTKKRHTCSICRQVGHHPQTCHGILDPERAERANLFLRQLIEQRKAQRYLDMWKKRVTSVCQACSREGGAAVHCLHCEGLESQWRFLPMKIELYYLRLKNRSNHPNEGGSIFVVWEHSKIRCENSVDGKVKTVLSKFDGRKQMEMILLIFQ